MNTMPEVGSLIMSHEDYFLGLVVDQVRGKEWTDSDEVLSFVPKYEDRDSYVLVRVLGQRVVEWPLRKNRVSEQEPNKAEIVRWEFVHVPTATHVAGPDVSSIEEFLRISEICGRIHGRDFSFLDEVCFLVEYLSGKQTPKEDMTFHHRMYTNMFERVLPKN